MNDALTILNVTLIAGQLLWIAVRAFRASRRPATPALAAAPVAAVEATATAPACVAPAPLPAPEHARLRAPIRLVLGDDGAFLGGAPVEKRGRVRAELTLASRRDARREVRAVLESLSFRRALEHFAKAS